jgi:hypothetical protein
MDEEAFDERLRAVERALTDEGAPDRIADTAALSGRVEDVERDVATVEERLDELDAAVQALRGYVGAVRGVNRDVERRADSALAKVERLETDVERRDQGPARGDRERVSRRGPESADASRPNAAAGADAGSRVRGVGDHPIPERQGSEERDGLLARIGAWL